MFNCPLVTLTRITCVVSVAMRVCSFGPSGNGFGPDDQGSMRCLRVTLCFLSGRIWVVTLNKGGPPIEY